MQILETERLSLHTATKADYKPITDLLLDERSQERYPKITNLEIAGQIFDQMVTRQEDDGYSLWVVRLKETAEFIGICGLLKQLSRESGQVLVEVTFRMKYSQWNKGYIQEAVIGCMKYAKEVLGLKHLIMIMIPEESKPKHIAEKLGFEFVKGVIYLGGKYLVYRVDL